MATAVKSEPKQADKLTDATILSIAVPKDYMDEANLAFTDLAEGEKRMGAADQRLAYAILCYAMELAVDASLVHRINNASDKSDARKFLLPKMREKFIGNRPAPKRVGKEVEPITKAMSDSQIKWDSRNALLKRAFDLAHYMSRNGVTFKQFNHKTGMFSVPGRGFAPYNDTTVEMLGLAKGNVSIDGSASIGYQVHTGKLGVGYRQVRTGSTQYIDANKPPSAPRAGSRHEADTTPVTFGSAEHIAVVLKTAKADAIAMHTEQAEIIHAMFKVFCEDGKDIAVKPGDYTKRELDELDAIAKRIQEIRTILKAA